MSTQIVYAARRAAAIYALTKYLRHRVIVVPKSAGSYIVVRFADDVDSKVILDSARECGIPLISLQPFYLQEILKQEYMLGFTYASEPEIISNIAKFAELIKRSMKDYDEADDAVEAQDRDQI